MADDAPLPTGRPTDYRPEYAEQAYKLCLLLGATDADLGRFFDVVAKTIVRWRAAHPEFAEACARGKAAADANVAASLYNRARGYEHEAVKIFMPAGAREPVYAPYTERFPPDTSAAFIWLRNRQPNHWRDRVEQTGANGGPIVTEVQYRWATEPQDDPAPKAE